MPEEAQDRVGSPRGVVPERAELLAVKQQRLSQGHAGTRAAAARLRYHGKKRLYHNICWEKYK